LKQWLAEAREHAPKNAFFVLMGTHLDLEYAREIDKIDAEKFMEANGISLFF
jgi:GTPase SAR1 family protein